MHETAYVLVILFIDLRPEAMRLTVEPRSIICSEQVLTIRGLRYDLDCPFAIFHAVLVLAQIDILIGNVLKPKTILLTFSRQISLPLSKIKRSIKIP